MPVRFNLRQLEEKNLRLQGAVPSVELELEHLDELIHVVGPVNYDVEVQRMESGVLVQGRLWLEVDCECVRCLKRYRQVLEVKDWATLLPLEGEDEVPVLNDSVDLTPYLREDMVLAFPQHPLCSPACGGLVEKGSEGRSGAVERSANSGSSSSAGSSGKAEGTPGSAETAAATPAAAVSSAWAELDKLKLGPKR